MSNPKIVQFLSNVYPMLIQSKSKSKVYRVLVQHLSNKLYRYPMIDQIKSRSLGLWTKFGQRLDNPVWTKIGLFLDSKYFRLMRSILWIKFGLTLDWLGCMNSCPAARGSQEAGFTQPRDHFYSPALYRYAEKYVG